jgi:hypothetical protein
MCKIGNVIMKKFLLNSCVSVIAVVGGMGILTPSVAMVNEEEKDRVPLNMLQPRVNTDPNNNNGYLKIEDTQFPHLVMQRIFQALEIDTQITVREVCHLWNLLGLETPGGKLTLFANRNYDPKVLASVGEHIPFLLRPGTFHVLVADGLAFAELLPQAIEPVRVSPETQAFLRGIVAQVDEQAPVTQGNFATKTKTHKDHPQLQRYLGALRLLAESEDHRSRNSLNNLPLLSFEDLKHPVAQNVMWCGYFAKIGMWMNTSVALNVSSVLNISAAHLRNEKFDGPLIERFLLMAFKTFPASDSERGLFQNLQNLSSSLITAYFNQGEYEKAFQFLVKHNTKDLEPYNRLLCEISQFQRRYFQPEEKKKPHIETVEKIITYCLQRFSEEEREKSSFFGVVSTLMTLYCEKAEYEKAFQFLVEHNIKDLSPYNALLNEISRFQHSYPQSEERKKFHIETVEKIITSYLESFSEEKREENSFVFSEVVNVFISLCCDQGEHKKIEAFLKRYEKDVDAHSSFLRTAVTVYCEKNDVERAHSVLLATEFRNLAVWKGYVAGLLTQLNNKSRLFNEQHVEDNLRIFIENFPEKEHKSIHRGFLKLIVALYSEKSRFQDIDLILKKYAGEGIKYRLGLIQSCLKSSRDNPLVRAYVLQKLEDLLKEVKGKTSEHEVGRRYIKNILKAPYDKDLFLQGETYLDTLLEKVKEMDSSSLEAIEEFNYLSSSSDDSDDFYTFTTSSSESSSEEEEGESEVAFKDESPRDAGERYPSQIDDMREELDLYKACFSLYQEATEEKAVAILEKGDNDYNDIYNIPYLIQSLKHRGVSSLKFITREALRNYILEVFRDKNYISGLWEELLLPHTKIVKELLKGVALTPEYKAIEEILNRS